MQTVSTTHSYSYQNADVFLRSNYVLLFDFSFNSQYCWFAVEQLPPASRSQNLKRGFIILKHSLWKDLQWLGIRAVVLFGLFAGATRHANAIVQYSINLKPSAPGYPSSLTLYAYCQDIFTGALYVGNPVSLTNNWVANSNAHLHPYSTGHPQSTLSNSNGSTGSDGYFHFDVQATPIGQDEYITVHCAPPPGGTTRDTQTSITVGYPDVFYNSQANQLKVGMSSNHGGVDYNRYITTYAGTQLWNTINDYLGLWPDTPDGKLAANDQALPYGGTFDLNATWQPPHDFHYRGTAADMRGNTADHTIPVSRQADFIFFCQARQAVLYQVEFATPGDTDTSVANIRRHCHCHWALIQ